MSDIEIGDPLAAAEEPAAPVPIPLPRGLARVEGVRALRHRNFRLFWAGQTVSLIGTHMQRVAQAWLILTLTNDPLMLGVAATAQYGPILLFGLLGGIAADSLPKRSTLVVTQVIAMLLAFTLAMLDATGTVQVWHVLVVALLLGASTVVEMPTRQSFVIEIVGREDVANAVALYAAVVNTAKVIGPAIAGLTIGALGVSAAFFLNGLSFLAVIAGLLAMRASELKPVERAAIPRSVRAVVDNLAEGLSYVRHTPQVLLVLAVLGLVSTVALNFTVVIPPLARDVLHAGPSGYGFLMSAVGLGSVITAAIMAFRGRPGTGVILGGALVLGILEAALGLSGWMPLSLACMFGMGLGTIAMSMGTNTVIQLSVPDVLRGRVMAVYLTLFAGTTPIGGLLMGGIAGAYGTASAILVGGLAAAGTAVAAIFIAVRWGLIGRPVRVEAAPDGREPRPSAVAGAEWPAAGSDVQVQPEGRQTMPRTAGPPSE